MPVLVTTNTCSCCLLKYHRIYVNLRLRKFDLVNSILKCLELIRFNKIERNGESTVCILVDPLRLIPSAQILSPRLLRQ